MISTFACIIMGINNLQRELFRGKKLKLCNEFDFMPYHCWLLLKLCNEFDFIPYYYWRSCDALFAILL